MNMTGGRYIYGTRGGVQDLVDECINEGMKE